MIDIGNMDRQNIDDIKDARIRLIAAGMLLIAKHGYDGTSVRDISSLAKQNVGAISYYFGDKQGLYTAIVEQIIKEARDSYQDRFVKIEQSLDKAELSNEEIIATVKQLMSDLFRSVYIANKMNSAALNIWTKEQFAPSHIFPSLYLNLHLPVHKLFCKLIGRLLNKDAESEEVKIRSYTIMGLGIFFRLNHDVVRRRMEWNEFSDGELDKSINIVAEQIEFILKGLSK